MATKRIQFFMTPAEFRVFVEESILPLSLEVLDMAIKKWDPLDITAYHRPLFIAPSGTERPSPQFLNPARDGWLVVTPPMSNGKKLYLAEVSAKSDWNEHLTSVTRKNPEVERLFGRVAYRLKRKLGFSVIASNEITGKSATYGAIGYSVGARIWLDDCGEWRQEGVDNIRYSLF